MSEVSIPQPRHWALIEALRAALRGLLWSRTIFWLVLFVPAWPLAVDLWWLKLYYAETMYITGVFSAQFLVATLSVTPLSLMIRKWEWGRSVGRWLLPRRRYLGLAAAGYAFLHAAHYVRYEADFVHILYEAMDLAYLVGWAAVIVFIPLSFTSNTWAVRRLGRQWKPLQRLVYLATAGAFLHWILLDRREYELYIWGSLLIVAKLVHIVLRQRQAAAPNRVS